MGKPTAAGILALLSVLVFWAGPRTAHGLPNPSTTYCTMLGYASQVKTADAGGQYGVCVFPDKTSCGAWAFLNGECGQARSYCEKKAGGKISAYSGSACPLELGQFKCAMCTLPGGATCAEWDLVQGKCPKPDAGKMQDTGPGESADDGGCTCTAAAAPLPQLWLLGLGALVLIWRRGAGYL